MGQSKNERRYADNEAMAKGRMFKTSPQKLNLVAQLIRGKTAEKALAELQFSRKRIAQDVKKVLESAIANAENNHDLDIDSLVVSRAFVGKNMVFYVGGVHVVVAVSADCKSRSLRLLSSLKKLRRPHNGSEGKPYWLAPRD